MLLKITDGLDKAMDVLSWIDHKGLPDKITEKLEVKPYEGEQKGRKFTRYGLMIEHHIYTHFLLIISNLPTTDFILVYYRGKENTPVDKKFDSQDIQKAAEYVREILLEQFKD